MKKQLMIFAIAFLLSIGSVEAKLPPVFGSEYDNISQKDEMTRVYISPIRIVWTSGGKSVTNESVLLLKGNAQADMAGTPKCSMISTESDTASIILDYGKELHGGLSLVMGNGSREPSLVRIRFGESVGEVCAPTLNTEWKVGYATDDHAKRDIVMEIPRDGSIELGNTGFRFVRIDLLQRNRKITIKEARAIFRYRDIPYLGSFKSSDQRLNDIWLTGAYTVHLNMQEYLWDGIKRDRVIWLGDMHPELMSINKVFGNNEVVTRSLDLACEQFPLPAWMNNMMPYSLWYLIIQHDYYMQNGDKKFLEKHAGYINGLVNILDKSIDADGNLLLKSRSFLDWPSSDNLEGVNTGVRALMVWALKDGAKLCKFMGDDTNAKLAVNAAERLTKTVGYHNNLKQAAAIMALAGVIDAKRACDEVVSVGGAKHFSTFYGYYMLRAMAMAGEYATAVDVISKYWGGMLEMGATTFWEDFDMDWLENAARLDEITPSGKLDIHGDFGAYCYPGYRHSFCHGWSSGPTAWMSEYILGVKILEPGCRVVKIEPHLGNLDWVEGTYPTPYGVIKISHKKDVNGNIKSEIRAPKGVKVVKK